MTPNCGGAAHAATHVEAKVIRWLAEIVALPATAEGILTSGGSMANFTALGAARRAVAPGVREEGVAGVPRLLGYAPDQGPHRGDKGGDLRGGGPKQLPQVPTPQPFPLPLH